MSDQKPAISDRAEIRRRIRLACFACADVKAGKLIHYVRYAPIESAEFPWGLSINFHFELEDHEKALDMVADYLTSAHLDLIGAERLL